MTIRISKKNHSVINTYSHDLAGNLTGILESDLAPYNQAQTFTYDRNNRLTDETSTAFGAKHYTYDNGNNRTSFTDASSGALVSCSYNALNQIVSLNSSGGKTATFGYDANGNRTTRTSAGVVNQYSYDGENRLIGVTSGSDGKVYSYTYDYRTRRVERVENGLSTKVIFSGGLSVKEYDNGSTYASVEYIRGHEMGGGIGGILYSNRGGALSFDHYNIRGDVVATTAASGAKTWQGWYDAFGTHTHEKGTAPQDRQRANTKEEDPTGLLNEGFRYRDLETGVFITRDPIGNTLMMPKEKWMVDGREVSCQEYEEALEPGIPQAGNGPTKTAKDSGAEAEAHIFGSYEEAIPGQKSHMHTAAAGFPNLYTYVNENPWTFFDPEGLDSKQPPPPKPKPKGPNAVQRFFRRLFGSGNEASKPTQNGSAASRAGQVPAPTLNDDRTLKPGEVKLSHYGYPADATGDTNTRNRLGNRGNTLDENSLAVRKGLAASKGLKNGDTVFINGKPLGKVDDTAPATYTNKRGETRALPPTIDAYDPHGVLGNDENFLRRLPSGTSITNHP